MKSKALFIHLILAVCVLTMFLVPLAGSGEFVFEETPAKLPDATPGPGARQGLEPTPDLETASALGPTDELRPTVSPMPAPAALESNGNGESIVSFAEVEPVEHVGDLYAVPTKTPIENDTWPKEIVVTFGGDCTIGNTVAQSKSPLGFKAVVEREGFAWPFSGIVDILCQDDLTLVNFEGTLTNQEDRSEKLYNFKGPTEYSNILRLGSVEAVNLANNHFIDYGQQGQTDTMQALDDANILYCASKQTAIYETRGVKIGLVGNTFPYKDEQRDISADVKALRDAGCQIVIASFHWGSENEYNFTREQRKIGRAAIQSGADIVVGHHSHVIQAIEKYEGTYILYSLANLVFGGNVDPRDKDSYLAQVTFTVNEDGSLQGEPKLKLIPVLLTSQSKGTDYRPVIVSEEKDYDRIMKKIMNKATNMEGFVNPR